jgi:hypothetical protein
MINVEPKATRLSSMYSLNATFVVLVHQNIVPKDDQAARQQMNGQSIPAKRSNVTCL